MFSGIKHHIEKIEFGNKFPEVVDDTEYHKIKFLSDDSVPLNRLIHFPALTVVIRCVFKQN